MATWAVWLFTLSLARLLTEAGRYSGPWRPTHQVQALVVTTILHWRGPDEPGAPVLWEQRSGQRPKAGAGLGVATSGVPSGQRWGDLTTRSVGVKPKVL